MNCVRLRFYLLFLPSSFIYCFYNPVQDTAASTVLTQRGFSYIFWWDDLAQLQP